MMKPIAVIALLCSLYGWHVATSPLVYEDGRLVDGGQRSLSWGGVFRMRGLSRESWTLIQSPQASHALNLLLHLTAVALVCLLFSRVTSDPFIAWSVALITAVHPLTGETVAYAASRSELIAAVGALLALISVTGPPWHWLGVLPALALAAAGKETGLVAIGLIPLVLWYQGRSVAARLTALLAVCLGLSALPWLGQWSRLGEYAGLHVTPVEWLGIQSVAVWRLVVLSVAPLWLSVSPEIPSSGWAFSAAIVLLAGSLELAWRARRAAPLLTLGIIGCALVAAPRFLVRTPGSPFNEHQWYLAVPFMACVVTAGMVWVETWWQAERAAWVAPLVPWEPR